MDFGQLGLKMPSLAPKSYQKNTSKVLSEEVLGTHKTVDTELPLWYTIYIEV